MALSNYSDLKQSVINWSHRNDMDLLIDDFIALTEADMFITDEFHEGLELRDMEGTATGALSGNTLALPSGFLSMRSMRLTGDYGRDLLPKTPDTLVHRTGTGLPKYYAIRDTVEFDIIPDSGYAYELVYFSKPTGLSTSNTTNSVLTKYPMIYLFGCLYHLFTYADDEAQANKYLRRYASAINGANALDEDARFGNAPYARIQGVTP